MADSNTFKNSVLLRTKAASQKAMPTSDENLLQLFDCQNHAQLEILLIKQPYLFGRKHKLGYTVLLSVLVQLPHMIADGKLSESIRIYLRTGADVHETNEYGNGALHCLILGQTRYTSAKELKKAVDNISNILQVFDILVEAGASINCANINKHTPLHLAAGINGEYFDDIFDYICTRLVSLGADTNIPDRLNNTPLHFAARFGRLEAVKLFLEHGVSSNFCNVYTRTPLHESVWTYNRGGINRASIIEALSKADTNLNAATLGGVTSMHMAAGRGYVCCIDALIQAGASVNCVDDLHRSPLIYAIAEKNRESVDRLLSLVSDINSSDIFGFTILHYAVASQVPDIVNLVLRYNPEVTAATCLGIQPMHLAGEVGEKEIIEMLLEHGANINCRDKWGATPLHYAASGANLEGIKDLLELGMEMNVVDLFGRKPLWHSLCNRDERTCRPLVDSSFEEECLNNLFPALDRESFKESEYEQEIEKLAGIMQNSGSETILNFFLHKGFNGLINYTGETNLMLETFEWVFTEVGKRIGLQDKRLAGKILKSGSTYEKTKLTFADEFDFIFCLEALSGIVCAQPANNLGYITLHRDAELPYNETGRLNDPASFDEFFLSDGVLDKERLIFQFYSVFYKSLVDFVTDNATILCEKGIFLLAECEFVDLDLEGSFPKISVDWRGKDFKGQICTIDFVPGILIKNYEKQGLSIRSLSPFQDKIFSQIYAVPKVGRDWDLINNKLSWRLSFSFAEFSIISEIPECWKEAYAVCKFIIQHLLPDLNSVNMDDKNEVHELQDILTSSCEDLFEYYMKELPRSIKFLKSYDAYDIAFLPNCISGTEPIFKVMFRLPGDNSTCPDVFPVLYSVAVDREVAASLNIEYSSGRELVYCRAASTSELQTDSGEEASRDTKDDDENSETFESEDEKETKPEVPIIRGKDVISSYFIKTAFFYELDSEIRLPKGLQSNANTFLISSRIFHRLADMIKDKNIASYFIPNLNLFNKFHESERGETFCRYAVKLLEMINPEKLN